MDASAMLNPADFLKCSFDKWYPLFPDVSIESEIIKLPNDVINYLKSDKFHLPKCCNDQFDREFKALSSNGDESMWASDKQVSASIRIDDEDSDDDGSDDLTSDSNSEVEFPGFEEEIQSVLDSMSPVFPKLNWKAPLDASWIATTSTLQCWSLADIFLLLKSSTKVVENFERMAAVSGEQGVEACIVLRKWLSMDPRREFRCFVRAGHMVAVCQRVCDVVCGLSPDECEKVASELTDFYRRRIRSRFTLDSFTMDVYREESGNILLVDFDVYRSADPLLYDWDEIQNFSIDDRPTIRVIFDKDRLISSRSHGGFPLEAREGNLLELAVAAHEKQQREKEQDGDSTE